MKRIESLLKIAGVEFEF